jgi:hypothetical protein
VTSVYLRRTLRTQFIKFARSIYNNGRYKDAYSLDAREILALYFYKDVVFPLLTPDSLNFKNKVRNLGRKNNSVHFKLFEWKSDFTKIGPRKNTVFFEQLIWKSIFYQKKVCSFLNLLSSQILQVQFYSSKFWQKNNSACLEQFVRKSDFAKMG